MSKKIRWGPQLVVMGMCLLVLLTITGAPLGVADGGSLHQRLSDVGLMYEKNPTADFMQFSYIFESITKDPYGTYQNLISFFKTRSQHQLFVTVGMAWFCGTLLMVGLWCLMRTLTRRHRQWLNYVFAVGMALMFTDYCYTLYFNSLYPEGFSYALLMLSVGILYYAIRIRDVSWWHMPAAAVATIFFSRMGVMEAIIGGCLGIVMLLNWRKISLRYLNIICILCGVVVVLNSAYFACTFRDSDYEKSIYNGVFFGVANYGSVAEIGLSPTLDVLAGQSYSEGIVTQYDLQNQLYSKVSYGTLLQYYTTHLGSAFHMVQAAGANAFQVRPTYLGNYWEGSVKPMSMARGFGAYSAIKRIFFPGTLFFVMAFFIAAISFFVFLHRKERSKQREMRFMIILCIMMGIAFKLPVFFNGQAEMWRSLFLFNILFDLVLYLGGFHLVAYLFRRREQVRDQFGVEQ